MLTPYQAIVVKEALNKHEKDLRQVVEECWAERWAGSATGLTLKRKGRAEHDLRSIEQIRGKL